MSNVFFIGDTHFQHHGLLTKFKTRLQFSNIDEHDEYIVDKINSIVYKKHDILWHLGDVAMGSDPAILEKTIGRIKCRKFLILGNHDHFHISEYVKYFEKIYGFIRYKKYWLSHAPIHPQEFYKRVANIHGHIHGVNKSVSDPRYICVSCEYLDDFAPMSLDEVKQRISDNLDKHFERLENDEKS